MTEDNTEDGKKKKGFFRKLFGLKSKEEKLAEAVAEKAIADGKVDEDMAERMAEITADALKAADAQDNSKKVSPPAPSDTPAVTPEAEETTASKKEETKPAKKSFLQSLKRKSKPQKETSPEPKPEAEKDLATPKKEAQKKSASEAEEVKAKTTPTPEKSAKAPAKKPQKKPQLKAKDKTLPKTTDAEKPQKTTGKKAKPITDERKSKEPVKKAPPPPKPPAPEKEIDTGTAETLSPTPAPEAPTPKDIEDTPASSATPTDLTEAETPPEPPKAGGFFSRMTKGLKKSTSRMSENMAALFTKRKLDDDAIEDLQDLLIAADFGLPTAMKVTDTLAKDRFDKQISDMDIKIALSEVISDILTPLETPLVLSDTKPQILLFVGVNGSGKTTTLGKLAKRYTDQGKKVLLAAGDTFRAAAVQQLTIWGERANAPVVSGKLGADAAGLVYEAVERAKNEDFDILMIDTAGRLQNRTELMDELSKVVRVIKKHDETAPHHCVLVLDATVGQNALSQTEAFRDTAGVTGLIMTKLDGTAKGGVLVALSDKYQLPIHAIGIGERVEDLENFSAPVFAAALSGVADTVLPEG